MLTVGDVEFETIQTKIFRLKPRVVSLVAGLHAEATLINMRTGNFTDGIEDVGEIAKLHAEQYASRRRELAEKKFLSALGLTIDSFPNRQRDMKPEAVLRLIDNLQWEDLGVEFIIAGTDSTGAHLYVIDDPGRAICHNGIAYVAIGLGARHAESAFMFSGYTRDWSAEQALYLAYKAKRRAEVAPSVGKLTDLFLIPMVGQTQRATDQFIESLNNKFDPLMVKVGSFETNEAKEVLDQVRSLFVPASNPKEGQDATAAPTGLLVSPEQQVQDATTISAEPSAGEPDSGSVGK